MRLGVLESPLFAREIEAKSVEKQPILEVIKRNPKEIILSALLRMSEQMPFYIFTVFVLEYTTDTLGFKKTFATNGVMVAAALALVLVPLFGHLSDRVGRKRMYITGAVLTGLWALPYFALLNTKEAAIVFITISVSLIPHNMQYGPQAALIAESFTDPPALQRRRDRLPARVGGRRRPGTAARGLDAAHVELHAADRALHHGRRGGDGDRHAAAPRARSGRRSPASSRPARKPRSRRSPASRRAS